MNTSSISLVPKLALELLVADSIQTVKDHTARLGNILQFALGFIMSEDIIVDGDESSAMNHLNLVAQNNSQFSAIRRNSHEAGKTKAMNMMRWTLVDLLTSMTAMKTMENLAGGIRSRGVRTSAGY